MKDPGPNPVELLAAILAKTGVPTPAAVSGPGTNPTLWPAIFFWKDFGLHHMTPSGNGDYSIAVENVDTHALCGNLNIKMMTAATTPATNDKVELSKSLFLPTTSLLRLQFAFAFPYTNTNRSYEIEMIHYDGTSKYTAAWRLCCATPATPQVQYIGSGGGWTVIADFTWLTGELQWNKVDITMNIADHTQHNVTVNDQSTNLSFEAFSSDGPADPPRLDLKLRLAITTAQQHTMYLDHILLTAPALEAS